MGRLHTKAAMLTSALLGVASSRPGSGSPLQHSMYHDRVEAGTLATALLGTVIKAL